MRRPRRLGRFFSVDKSPLFVRQVAAACPSAVDCGSLFFPFLARLVFLSFRLTADTDAGVPRSPRHTATVAAGSRDPSRRDGGRLQLVTREPGSGGWPWHHSLPPPPPASRLSMTNQTRCGEYKLNVTGGRPRPEALPSRTGARCCTFLCTRCGGGVHRGGAGFLKRAVHVEWKGV